MATEEESEWTTENPDDDSSTNQARRMLDEHRQYGEPRGQLSLKKIWPVVYYGANHAENNFQEILDLINENTELRKELNSLREEFGSFKAKIADEMADLRKTAVAVRSSEDGRIPSISPKLDVETDTKADVRPTYAAVSGRKMPKKVEDGMRGRSADSQVDQGSSVNQPSTVNQEQSTEGWTQPKSRRRKVIRGSLLECSAAEPAKKALFELLKTSHRPRIDFLVSGIKHVKDTDFRSVEGKPDVLKYAAALKEQLEAMELDIRFVKIFTPREGDFRGTMCARIGGLAEEKIKILCSETWPQNVFVRPWNFDVKK